ncbi:40329_t:CDS:1, partial [Gigaspora margarita]
ERSRSIKETNSQEKCRGGRKSKIKEARETKDKAKRLRKEKEAEDEQKKQRQAKAEKDDSSFIQDPLR